MIDYTETKIDEPLLWRARYEDGRCSGLTTLERAQEYAELFGGSVEPLIHVTDKQVFVAGWNAMAFSAFETACDKGFWATERNDGECIALMHSELSEALEALRHGNQPDDHLPDFSGAEVELADVIIRIMDYSCGRNLRVGEAVLAKMAYNANRPKKHGKEF